MKLENLGVVRWGRQGLNRMVCFLLFFAFLPRMDWNGEVTGRRAIECTKIESSPKTAVCSVGTALLLWAKMDYITCLCVSL